MKKVIHTVVILLLNTFFVQAQNLKIISSPKLFKQSIKINQKNKMVDLKKLIPNLQIDLQYATKNNFTKAKLYNKANSTFMRAEPANALAKIQQQLNLKGFGLKIFDAYRPFSITKKMWTLIKDERYVANPKYGSGHNKGIAVDLTIINLATGIELAIGTSFDNFTDSAHHAFTNKLSDTIVFNRSLLKSIMILHGFKPLETEWWHYYWNSNDQYEVLDLSFKEMIKISSN